LSNKSGHPSLVSRANNILEKNFSTSGSDHLSSILVLVVSKPSDVAVTVMVPL